MSSPLLALVVAICGGLGAVGRYGLDSAVQRRIRRATPYGTITVNVVGSLVLGLVTGLVVHHHVAVQFETVIGVGFCGGLTTFSSASFETVRLLREGLLRPALNAAVGGMTLSCLAGALGLAMALA